MTLSQNTVVAGSIQSQGVRKASERERGHVIHNKTVFGTSWKVITDGTVQTDARRLLQAQEVATRIKHLTAHEVRTLEINTSISTDPNLSIKTHV